MWMGVSRYTYPSHDCFYGVDDVLKLVSLVTSVLGLVAHAYDSSLYKNIQHVQHSSWVLQAVCSILRHSETHVAILSMILIIVSMMVVVLYVHHCFHSRCNRHL